MPYNKLFMQKNYPHFNFFYLLFFLFFTVSSFSQSIWTNPITGSDPNDDNPYTAGQTVNSNITVSGIGRGSEILGENANDRYNASNWTTNNTIDTNDYFTFTLTPNSGYKINLTNFIYTGEKSKNGPEKFAFRSSVDCFSTNIGTASESGTTIDLSGSAYQNISTAIEFRIYGWDAKKDKDNDTFSINDFTFNGSVQNILTTTGVTICQGDAPQSLTSTSCVSSGTSSCPNNAGTATNIGSGEEWKEVGNITTTNNRAKVKLKKESSQYLQGTNYVFAIPTGAIINGITVAIFKEKKGKDNIEDVVVSLVKGGNIIDENKAKIGEDWQKDQTEVTYGGIADLWGTTWTAADINATNFGVVLSAKNEGKKEEEARVYYMQITVNYTVNSVLYWYTSSSGGTSIGTGASFNPIGVAGSGLPNTNTAGTTIFYAECSSSPGFRIATNFVINAAAAAPTVGAITQPTCTTATGSVVLSGLPTNWTLTRSPGSITTTGTGTSTTISGLAAGTYTYTVIGSNNGTGLKGEYFNNRTLTGSPALTRTDATVNFDWVNAGPGTPIGNDDFSVRWSGQIQPLSTTTYTFRTKSDDGVRLRVNGTQIINNWDDHSWEYDYGTINLTAGVKYDIVLEYYERGGQAVAELNWSTTSLITAEASRSYQIIPQSQLYPAASCGSLASANVVINASPTINYWNGSVSSDWNTASNWTCGVPSVTNDMDAVVPLVLLSGHTYPILNLGLEGYAKNIVFENGSTLNVIDNSLEVSGVLTLNGFIDLEGESQLVQTTGSTFEETSTGYIEIDQQGEGNSFRYNYWSSPVNSRGTKFTIDEVLKDGTDMTKPNKNGKINFGAPYAFADGAAPNIGQAIKLSTYWMYVLRNSGLGYSAWFRVGNTGEISVGEGYTMKGSNTSAATQNYTFVGKPNNGDITLPLTAGFNYLVGNPYPSAIDADQFLWDNSPSLGTSSITGTIYFWEHYGGNTHNLGGYQAGYATYSLSGGVQASAFPGLGGGISVKGAPKQYIPVGQAFFVVGDADGGNIIFNNGQRAFVKESKLDVNGDPFSVFMKSNNTKVKTANKPHEDLRPKFRIGFDAPKISHRQLLLTIDDRASKAVDWGFDAEIYEIFADDMYWMLDNKKYVIQGTNTIGLKTEVPLGIQLSKTGLVTVKIDALENVDKNIHVFLKDNVTGESHEITTNPIQLNLEAGKYTDRFALTFKVILVADENALLMNEDVLFSVKNPLIAEDVSMVQNEQPLNIGVHVFMNNSISELQINNVTNTEILNINLFNNVGQLVNSWNTNLNKRDISLPVHTATGIYNVQITTINSAINRKIIVE